MGQVNNAMGIFDSECKRLLGKDFMSCMTKIGEFAATFKTLQTDDERAQALFGLFLSLKLYEQTQIYFYQRQFGGVETQAPLFGVIREGAQTGCSTDC